jgi:hypothetical protein
MSSTRSSLLPRAKRRPERTDSFSSATTPDGCATDWHGIQRCPGISCNDLQDVPPSDGLPTMNTVSLGPAAIHRRSVAVCAKKILKLVASPQRARRRARSSRTTAVRSTTGTATTAARAGAPLIARFAEQRTGLRLLRSRLRDRRRRQCVRVGDQLANVAVSKSTDSRSRGRGASEETRLRASVGHQWPPRTLLLRCLGLGSSLTA